MKIKKFTARTFSEALELVKKELSQDAVILSTEEKKGFRPHVEVTAAVDYEAADGSGVVRSSQFGVRSDVRHPQATLSDRTDTRESIPRKTPNYELPTTNAFRADGDLRGEISSLRAMIESLKNNGYEMSLPTKKRAVLNFLRDRQVREEFALRLCDKTSDITDLPRLISSDISVRREQQPQKAVMFVGPTGVGKTTTIAKLTAQAVKAGKKAAILNLDTYRIGAVEQSRIYARILGIPLVTASTGEEFRRSLTRLSAERDVVYIDTTGRNPRDENSVDEIAGLCSVDIPLELHLLMSANSDDACMIEAYRTYRKLPINYVGFSKIDEAVRYGALYNILLTYQKPVAWLTTGQRVPGDIEPATVNRLAGLITTKECSVC